MFFSKEGKHLPIQSHPFFVHGTDKRTVRESFVCQSGADTHVPKAAHVIFFVAAVRESVLACMSYGIARGNFFFTPGETVTLGFT